MPMMAIWKRLRHRKLGPCWGSAGRSLVSEAAKLISGNLSGFVKRYHHVDQLLVGKLRAVELADDAATVEDDEAVGRIVDVEDVVVDEDRRLPLFPDRADEGKHALRLLQRKPHC